jgi:hypothetical protein
LEIDLTRWQLGRVLVRPRRNVRERITTACPMCGKVGVHYSALEFAHIVTPTSDRKLAMVAGCDVKNPPKCNRGLRVGGLRWIHCALPLDHDGTCRDEKGYPFIHEDEDDHAL